MEIQATLNLATGFRHFGKNIEIETSRFPAGEMYIQTHVPIGTRNVRINSRFKGSDDLMLIFLAVDSLKRQGVDYVELFLPYLPYSRQDRVCNRGESFSLKVIAHMLFSYTDRLITYDVHSNVPLTLMDHRIKCYNNTKEVIDFVRYVNPDKIPLTLVVPDAGALKKCQKLLDITGLFVKMIVCHKTRVGNMVVCNDIEEDLDGQDAIVIDDICDGGRTFIELAKKLKERNVGNLSLFVSHGIFSAGINALSSHYGQIGTTNSMNSEGLTSMGVKCFELDY